MHINAVNLANKNVQRVRGGCRKFSAPSGGNVGRQKCLPNSPAAIIPNALDGHPGAEIRVPTLLQTPQLPLPPAGMPTTGLRKPNCEVGGVAAAGAAEGQRYTSITAGLGGNANGQRMRCVQLAAKSAWTHLPPSPGNSGKAAWKQARAPCTSPLTGSPAGLVAKPRHPCPGLDVPR